MPHQLRHGPTLYNGHLRGPVTLTPVAESECFGSGAVTSCITIHETYAGFQVENKTGTIYTEKQNSRVYIGGKRSDQY